MNARVCCSLIAVLLCLSVCLSTTDAKKHAKVKRNVRLDEESLPAKPGVCPDDKDMIGVCVEDCFGDSECPYDEKCCSNGCGHQCTPPYDERPGMCPVSLVGEEGPCGELCVSDFECSNLEKCCSSICGGRVCTRAF